MSRPNRKVLICDDQPLLRKVLAGAISECWPNVEITETKDGMEGEKAAKEGDFDVIFMDVEMPRQNGFDTVSAIRAVPALAQTPIVMCTGCSGEADVVRGWQLNVEYYLTKPFDVEEIDNVLDEIKWADYELVS